MRVLIAGCGYVGLALGERLVAAGHSVAGIRRPGSDPAPLRRRGIDPFHANLATGAGLNAIPLPWDWVVACAAPSDGTEAAYREVYVEGCRNLLAWLRPSPPRALVFTGSTGVYPQNDGSEVDETASTEGGTPTGRVLREAEDLLLRAASEGFPAVVLRIAGIYGPGRNRIESVRRGEWRGPASPARWMNMVHRDDLVEAIVAALDRGRAGRIYNVSDGAPCTEREFREWLSGRLGIPLREEEAPTRPPTKDLSLSRSRTRTGSNKRVIAARIRQELGWSPGYADFRAGYEAEILASAKPGPLL
ncbi:MAG: SDR family oxidoreductase [Limisphaerales bacterium]